MDNALKVNNYSNTSTLKVNNYSNTSTSQTFRCVLLKMEFSLPCSQEATSRRYCSSHINPVPTQNPHSFKVHFSALLQFKIKSSK
jgi:hypothetical protein